MTSSSFRHEYHQTFVFKLKMCERDWWPTDFKAVAKMSDFTEPVGILVNNCEQILEIIRRLDILTLGIPKIAYMSGWQKGGHDAQYPAWGPLDRRIKRDQDTTPLESFCWLFSEAKKYNTTVSVHINMIDAHPFSPLFDLYYKNDIIAKEKDGSLRSYVWGFPISYTREWELGFAQRRIDQLCELLPIQEAGTVHIDAFHSYIPLIGDTSYISPYLGISCEEEAETQKKILSYFRAKGVNVTAEYASRFRVDSLIGLQPMALGYDEIDLLRLPPGLYCGGRGNDLRGGQNMGINMKTISQTLDEAPETILIEFSRTTAIWYYLNRLERLAVDEHNALIYSDGVKSWLENTIIVDNSAHNAPDTTTGDQYITRNGDYLRECDDVFIPALWKDKTIIASSKEGYKNREWVLPDDWNGIKSVAVNELSLNGFRKLETINVENCKVKLSLYANKTVVITPQLI
jgi:hypothetical protein